MTGVYLEGQTGLMQITWNTQGTVNAAILRTTTRFFSVRFARRLLVTPTFKFVAPCIAPVCLHCLNSTKHCQFIL